LLESHRLELLYVQLLSYMKSMALFWMFQRNAHNCDDEYVPARDLIDGNLMWNFDTIKESVGESEEHDCQILHCSKI
jgi:hypothetical protein